MFLDPTLLYDAGIPAIRKHLRQKLAYLCLHKYSGPFGPKWRGFFWRGGKYGKGWCDVDPNELVFTFGGC